MDVVRLLTKYTKTINKEYVVKRKNMPGRKEERRQRALVRIIDASFVDSRMLRLNPDAKASVWQKKSSIIYSNTKANINPDAHMLKTKTKSRSRM